MFMHVVFENEAILKCLLSLPTTFFHILLFLLERLARLHINSEIYYDD